MKVLLIGAGYVGSYLAPYLSRRNFEVCICDQRLERLVSISNSVNCKYQLLTIDDLSRYEAILWFAGHSSVPASISDPDGALSNNCLDLFQLASRKRPSVPLIYASTGSVYSVDTNDGEHPPTLDETETRLNPVNPYDCSKLAFDAIATCFAANVVGLRLGTVSGHSPALRPELIFNAMNLAAMKSGYVNVSNAQAHRSILFLEDLAFYVEALLRSQSSLPKILNVASHNATVGQLAEEVSAFHGSDIRYGKNTKTYSFRMNTDLIRKICGEPPSHSIREHCATFKQNVLNGRLTHD